MATILIKNGLIYDGEGKPPFKADILISGNKIVKISVSERHRAHKIFDATNAIVTPGFIDVGGNLNFDLDIFSIELQENSIRQGITTVIGGNGGMSVAPVSVKSLRLVSELRTETKVNINWRFFKDFFGNLNRIGLKINFGTLFGYNTIRNFVQFGDDRDLTENEIRLLRRILLKSLADGALGMSFMIPASGPQEFLNRELKVLLEIIAHRQKVFCVGINEVRDKFAFVEEALNFAQAINLNLEIKNFQPQKNEKESFEKARKAIENNVAATFVNFDLWPFSFSILPIREILFSESNLADVIVAYLPKVFTPLIGLTLQEIQQRFYCKSSDAILKLRDISGEKALFLKRDIDESSLNEFLFAPNSIISSGGLNFFSRLCVGGQSFLQFLALAKKMENYPLERAVMKITSLPAKKYGIEKRGSIKENYYADINILREDNLERVFVNGKQIFDEGVVQKIKSGMIIKKA